MLNTIRKIDWLHSETGYGNWYVAIPPWHKYHWIEYDDIPVEVHGWLTFSNMMNDKYREKWQEFSHFPNWYWIIWFDTAHYWDNQKDQNIWYVQDQINKLIKQL